MLVFSPSIQRCCVTGRCYVLYMVNCNIVASQTLASFLYLLCEYSRNALKRPAAAPVKRGWRNVTWVGHLTSGTVSHGLVTWPVVTVWGQPWDQASPASQVDFACFTDQTSHISPIRLCILHRSDLNYFTDHTWHTSQIRLCILDRSDFSYFTDQTSHVSQIRLHTLHRSDFAFFTDRTVTTSWIRHGQLEVEAFMCVWGETSTLPVQRFDRGALAAVLNWVSEQINTNSLSVQRESCTEIIKDSLALKMSACRQIWPLYKRLYQWVFFYCCFTSIKRGNFGLRIMWFKRVFIRCLHLMWAWGTQYKTNRVSKICAQPRAQLTVLIT